MVRNARLGEEDTQPGPEATVGRETSPQVIAPIQRISIMKSSSTATSEDDRERARLFARIQANYSTISQRVDLGNLSIELLQVDGPDEELIRLGEEAESTGSEEYKWQPYWVQAWDSAIAVGQMLARQNLNHQSVLDLGCGLGLTGAVAAARGARVVLCDVAQPALLFARVNTWPWRDRVHVQRVDWRVDQLTGQQFRWIVGADILYDRQDWEYLEPFWRYHLVPGGTVLLGEPARTSAREFPEWLTERGWTTLCSGVRVEGCAEPIRIVQAHVVV